jgi:hypothetical protein
MNKEGFSIISIVSIKHKILSCVLAFFVLISSMNLLNFEEQKKTIMKSVEISTTIVLNQFFNISALPVSSITKLFSGINKSTAKKESTQIQLSKETAPVVQQQTAKTISNSTTSTENNKGTATKDKNSSKASMGYSIIAGTSGIIKVINNEGLKDLEIANKLTETNFVRYADSINVVLSEKVINIMFVMMLLLAILLARRNVGDNNIINNNINNKNNRITRFI